MLTQPVTLRVLHFMLMQDNWCSSAIVNVVIDIFAVLQSSLPRYQWEICLHMLHTSMLCCCCANGTYLYVYTMRFWSGEASLPAGTIVKHMQTCGSEAKQSEKHNKGQGEWEKEKQKTL